MQYTAAQQGAIDNKDEHKLVVAIPGSGKTHLTIGLVENILRANPNSSVLSVTFTNAASKEMKGRLSKRIGKKEIEERCHISTFAALMLQQARPTILRNRSLKIGAGAWPFINRALSECGYTSKEDRDIAIRALEDSAKILDDNEVAEHARELRAAYLKALRSSNAVCLDTLVRELMIALENGDVPLHPATHIVVDEYQDTDALQYDWLRIHGKAGAIITAVGDDDQSIYSWRQSYGYENMAQLIKDFSIRPTVLEHCFRCPQEVLDIASKLIEHNTYRLPKTLTSGIETKGLVRRVPLTSVDINDRVLELSGKKNNSEQASAYYQNILNKIEGKSIANFTYIYTASEVLENPGEWAILARTNQELDDMEEALSVLQLPYIRMGGKSIWENETIMVLAQTLFVICEKHNARYLGALLMYGNEDTEEISKILRFADTQGFLGANEMLVDGQWNSNTRALYALATAAQEEDISPKDIFNEAANWVWQIKESEINSNAKSSYAATATKERVERSFDSFQKIIKAMFLGGSASLSRRAQVVTNRVFGRRNTKTLSDRTNEVVLTTINSSKGLEFQRVWVINVEAATIPSKIRYTMMADEPLVMDCELEQHRMREERRLLYVAVTRAEKELVLSYRPDYGSGFLKEMFGEEVLSDLD